MSAPASLAIAGINTRPLQAAALGIAGNWGSTLRPRLQEVTMPPAPAKAINRARVGDRAVTAESWRRAVYLLDYTYVACPDRRTQQMRYRPGFEAMCAPDTRRLPLYLDSAAFREAQHA
jgi:hypothetical protein